MFVPKLVPPEMKERGIIMRREGHSINQIAKATGMAKSTVSLLVRDIRLDPQQDEDLRAAARLRGHRSWSQHCRRQRHGYQLMGRALAQLGEADYAAGVMLYWAEGSKGRNSAALTNSDPDLLRLWLDWLEAWHCDRSEAKLTINCFLGNGLALEEIEDWWLQQLRLPRTSLRKPVVNNPSSASKGVRRKLVYGTARVRVNSTFVVQSIYGAIQEIGGFDRPEWLDLERAMPEAP